jgi:hypothetical protein
MCSDEDETLDAPDSSEDHLTHFERWALRHLEHSERHRLSLEAIMAAYEMHTDTEAPLHHEALDALGALYNCTQDNEGGVCFAVYIRR